MRIAASTRATIPTAVTRFDEMLNSVLAKLNEHAERNGWHLVPYDVASVDGLVAAPPEKYEDRERFYEAIGVLDTIPRFTFQDNETGAMTAVLLFAQRRPSDPEDQKVYSVDALHYLRAAGIASGIVSDLSLRMLDIDAIAAGALLPADQQGV